MTNTPFANSAERELRLLIVEDCELDAEIICHQLTKSGYKLRHRRVESLVELEEALRTETWDLVISDYSLPGFTGLDAFKTHQKFDRFAPFLIVSGTIGEETAILAMKAGVSDYILKDNLTRLPSAVSRELRDAESRRLRRQAEERLKQSEAEFRTLSETVPAMIWTNSHDGHVEYCNARWTEYGGLTPERSAIAGWHALIHPEDRLEFDQHWQNSLANGATFEMQARLKRGADREYRWHLVRAIALSNEAGQVEKWIGFAVDIDDQKKVEEKLRSLNLLRSEFASIVSHELRTPLTAICEGVDLVLEGIEGPINAGQRETLDLVKDSAGNLSHLVENVLSFERSDAGRWTMQWQDVKIQEIAEEAIASVRTTCRRQGITLAGQGGDSQTTLFCDPSKIRQVLVNLLDNAVKFTPHGGRIDFKTWDDGPNAFFSVTDSGPGIAPEDQRTIFDIFVQGSKKIKTFAKGTGLGLSICKMMVELHNGEITLTSTPGKGSVFTVRVPLRQADSRVSNQTA